MFKTFLRGLEGEDSPEGDFAEDALRDRRFPENLTSWGQLEFYLTSRGSSPEAIEAASRAWDRYRSG